MSIILIIRRITNSIQNLARELEVKNMINLAQVLQMLVHKARDIERICMYTSTTTKLFKSLNERTRDIAKRITENPDAIKEGIEEFVQVLSRTIATTLSSYLRLKLVTATLTTLYVLMTTELIRMYTQSTLALIFSFILLWQGMILLLLMFMNLTISLFVIPVIPLTSILISVIYLDLANELLKSSLTTLHFAILVLSLVFIAKNIGNYSKLKVLLKDLENSLETLTDAIKRIPKTTLTPAVLDPELYLGVYGDKAYELIKYVNDMQKLLGQ